MVWEDDTPYLGAGGRNIFYKTNKDMTTTVTQTQTDTITESNYDTITNIEKTTQTEYEYKTVVETSTEIQVSTTEIIHTKSVVKWSNFFILPLLFFQLARRKRK